RGATDALAEAVLVGIYLVFLLVEAGRLPRRLQAAYRGKQLEQILAVVENVNDAIARYLRAKVLSSVVLALPATVVLWIFGVKFALMWGVLTFLFNFIPYLGSVITCSGPVVLAFLQMDSPERAGMVAVFLLVCHLLSAYAIEPSMIGKAVGLSPLIVL